MPDKPMRLFFGIKPEPALQQGIAALRAALPRPEPGRPVAVENIHITLAFLGDTPPSLIPELSHQAEQLAGPAFELSLSTLGWFRRSQVLWLAPQTVPEPMLQLATDLRRVAASLGLHQETKPFRPHITLFRKVRNRPDLPEDVSPLVWSCRQFALYASEMEPGGVHYPKLAHWNLNFSA